MAQVIIGIDPHKGSHTAVALSDGERTLGQLRVIAAPGQVEQLQRWAAPGQKGFGRSRVLEVWAGCWRSS